jgi:CubicO group peptidase (beta-lactamase class C family)
MIGAKMMNRSWCGRPLAICAVGIAVVVVTLAASVSAADFSASDALMLRLMSTHNVPGSALALIKDGSIVLEKGYGFRDLAAHAPVTTATLFNIGSISKSFTALGVAQLVDEHQVDLEAPVIRYIPDLRLSDPQATQAVTLRQLLSHTSGLPADEQWPQQVPTTRDGIDAVDGADDCQRLGAQHRVLAADFQVGRQVRREKRPSRRRHSRCCARC